MPTLEYYIYQFKVLPVSEIIGRMTAIGKRLTCDRIRKVKAVVFGTDMTDRKFIEQAFGEGNVLFEQIRMRKKRSCFTSPDPLNEALSALTDSGKRKIIAGADKICDHKFNLLGSGEVSLGPTIDWHRDFKTGHRWNLETWYHDIKIPYRKADIKVPWELSRFSHAVMLGQAYVLTGDKKYSREFTTQVSDWIDANKPQFGVNWNCTMEVAIRACNWIAGYSLFQESHSLDEAFLLKFLKSLYQHGLHIRANLEYSDALTTNHYLANIAGLVYIGVLFPQFKEAVEWRQFAIREMVREMEKQVYRDGCDFEASTCYHRLVLELFFFPAIIVVANDEQFTGSNHADICRRVFGYAYTDKLHRMFRAVLYLLKPNGRMPQIGDNDNGRLHVFANRDILDMRYLLTLGAVFFKEPAFKVREFGFCEEAFWVFGNDGRDIWNRLPESTLADIGSIAFQDAGWYIMRNNKDYMMISCGPNGQNGVGGHAHNDKLSLELCIDGEDIIVDPGTPAYTADPAMRNLFRSTAFHNTVMINGEEQNHYSSSPLLLFTMPEEDRRPFLTEWRTGDSVDIFIGGHSGYMRFPPGILHSRQLKFFKKERRWEIIDRFEGEGKHELEWNFILAPQQKCHVAIESSMFSWSRVNTFFSPQYGVKVPTEKLTAQITADLPFKNVTLIGWRPPTNK